MKKFSCTVCCIILALSQCQVAAQEGLDSDSDGMSDAYESANGLDIWRDDRFEDLDGDGYPNLAEYRKGTSANLPDGLIPDIVVPDDYPTLSAAVASVTVDDTVIVIRSKLGMAPYEECINNTGPNAKRIFIIAEEVDSFKTVIRNPVNDENDFVIASSRDLYISGLRIVASDSGVMPRSAIKLIGDGTHSIVRCVIHGGLYGVLSTSVTKSKLDVVGCLIQYGKNAGLMIENLHESRIAFSTITEYSGTADEGMGVGITTVGADDGSSILVTNSILWNAGVEPEVLDLPDDDDHTASVIFQYSNVRGMPLPYPNVYNLQNGAPGLIQGMLAYSSACIDAASIAHSDPPAPNMDIRGKSRIAGSYPDCGAHEFDEEAVEEDLDGDGLPDSRELYVTRSLFYDIDTDADGTHDGTDASPTNASVTELDIVITKPAAN